MRRVRTKISRVGETLESRNLLAGDFRAGDANMDYYLDEVDVLQVAKFGKYDTGEPATWAQGDWDGDGVFARSDVILFVRQTTVFREGPYDPAAGEPTANNLVPLSTVGDADVTLFYFPQSGDLTAVSTTGITALHLASRSASFQTAESQLFNFTEPANQFVWHPFGANWIEHPGLLRIGLTEQQVVDDLLVDGALLGGGGLGNVRFGDLADFRPDERPDDAIVTGPVRKPSFVDREEAKVIVTYNPDNGDISVEALGVRFHAFELESPDGFFTGTVGAEDRFTIHAFDNVSPTKIHFQATDLVDGNIVYLEQYESLHLPGIAKLGLTTEDFTDSVHPTAVELFWDERTSVSHGVAIELATPPNCQDHLANGYTAGDANLDGRFDSQDLVTVFRAAEYEDGIAGNSVWNEGDWNCDGDFDTRDLVAAFQVGNYEQPAAAIAARLSERENEPTQTRRLLDKLSRGTKVYTVAVLDRPATFQTIYGINAQETARDRIRIDRQAVDSLFDVIEEPHVKPSNESDTTSLTT